MTTPRIVTSPRLPSQLFPIAIIGTGGIVKDAHLPAYRKAGFPVWGLMNRSLARAEVLAKEFGIPRVFGSLEEMVAAAPGDTIYDLALPAFLFGRRQDRRAGITNDSAEGTQARLPYPALPIKRIPDTEKYVDMW